MNVTPDDYPVISGFNLDTSLKCDLAFSPLAIAEYDDLLRSGAYRSKSWQVPPDANAEAIPAFKSFHYELYAIPGAVIWGFGFTDSANAGPFSFQVRDACTDVVLFSEHVRTDAYADVDQQFLPKLLTIATPGLISVEVCSLQATDARGVQLVLYGAEPVAPVECS